jgi:hypothetical protein
MLTMPLTEIAMPASFGRNGPDDIEIGGHITVGTDGPAK